MTPQQPKHWKLYVIGFVAVVIGIVLWQPIKEVIVSWTSPNVAPHLRTAKSESDDAIENSLQDIRDFFDDAKQKTRSFAETAVSFGSKWRLAVDNVPRVRSLQEVSERIRLRSLIKPTPAPPPGDVFLDYETKGERNAVFLEQVAKKFGGRMGAETVETVAGKTMQWSAKYGDDAVNAVKNVGQQAFRLAENAGEHSGNVLKLLSKYGDNAVLICEKPNRLRLFARYGDDAAEAMIRHGDNADILVQQYGKSAAGALARVEPQNGRRLMQMNESGELAKIGGADRVLGVIERYGNKGAEFIWNNKGALAVGTVAAAFYKDPGSFIDGGKTLGSETINKMNGIVLTLIVVGFFVIIFRKPLWKLVFPKQQQIASESGK